MRVGNPPPEQQRSRCERANERARLCGRARPRDADPARGGLVAWELRPPSPKAFLAARRLCAGVDRAVQTVEKALELHGPPVYVRKEIVHNKHVVEQLAARGAIFVEQESEVPEGEPVVFSAHGVAPAVHENSAARNLRTIDATCPLVTKVKWRPKSSPRR